MGIILHITSKDEWDEACQKSTYPTDGPDKAGFIHCSTPDQLIEVANHVFKGKNNLILLVIEESKIRSEIRYEDGGNKKLYPHIYGPINLDAVRKAVRFPANPDGTFSMPEGCLSG